MEFLEFYSSLIGYLFQMTCYAHEALESKNYRKVREINSDMKSLLQQTELIQELENFEKRRKNNLVAVNLPV